VKPSVRKTPRALRDLAELSQFIARDDVDVALRFLDAADEACEKLAAMPGMGTVRGFTNPAFSAVRFWPVKGFTNYLIFYEPTERGITLLRVLHGARDIDAIFERDS
jgi:toxin ParE1/3/4